jgi:hypothetical protein
MRLVKIINLVRFNGDFIFVIVCDVLMLSKWCITICVQAIVALRCACGRAMALARCWQL